MSPEAPTGLVIIVQLPRHIVSTYSQFTKLPQNILKLGILKKIFRFKKITSTHTVIIVQLPRHIVSTYLLTVYKKLP